MSIKTKEALTVYLALERMHNECSKRKACYKCPYKKMQCDLLGPMPCELDMDDIYTFLEEIEETFPNYEKGDQK